MDAIDDRNMDAIDGADDWEEACDAGANTAALTRKPGSSHADYERIVRHRRRGADWRLTSSVDWPSRVPRLADAKSIHR